MRATGKTRWLRGAAFLCAGSVAVLAAGCGRDDFENRPSAPPARELTGVIQADKLTISPDRVGAGPILITISNQTPRAHTVTLEGEGVRERLSAINPQDVGTIQKTLEPGSYEVSAGSSTAVPKEIEPAEITVGARRASSDGRPLPP